jgi:hypothetical protein
VRQVRFLDADVAYWQAATQHYMVSGSSTAPPKASKVYALEGTRCGTAWAAPGGEVQVQQGNWLLGKRQRWHGAMHG